MDNLDNLKNDIKIPSTIDLAVKKGIERGKKDKRKKKLQSTYKKVAAAIAILVVTTSFVVTHPNIAMAIPGVKSIFKLIGYSYRGENFEKLQEFSNSINQTVENNGIKVTIDEVTINDNILAITSTVEGNNIKNDDKFGKSLIEEVRYHQLISLNGKHLSHMVENKKIDDNTLVTMTYANISDIDLEEVVDVDIDIKSIGEVYGSWNFKFQVSKANKETNSKVINVDKTIKIPKSTLKFDNVVISSLGSTINYSGTYDADSVIFRNSIRDFVVMDDKGKILQIMSPGASFFPEKYQGKIEILNDLTNVKSLTVIPIFKYWGLKRMYIDDFIYDVLQTTVNNNFDTPQELITEDGKAISEEKTSENSLNKKFCMFNIDKARAFSSIEGLINQSIKVGNSNTATIRNIEISEKETKVTFKIDGNGAYPYRQISDMVIIDETYNKIINTKYEEKVVFENLDEGIVSMKLPPIDKTKKYKIALPIIEEPEIDEQYKANIDLTCCASR